VYFSHHCKPGDFVDDDLPVHPYLQRTENCVDTLVKLLLPATLFPASEPFEINSQKMHLANITILREIFSFPIMLGDLLFCTKAKIKGLRIRLSLGVYTKIFTVIVG
jgi:hypothetical protein